MQGYCFGGGAATRERRSREEVELVLILLVAPPPILLAGLPHTAFNALIPPATQAVWDREKIFVVWSSIGLQTELNMVWVLESQRHTPTQKYTENLPARV